MADLQYIIGLGFSGADFPRALILTFLLAMFIKKDTNIWKVGLLALFIDKGVWPILAMATTGAGGDVIYASVAALFQTFLNDIGIYIVRYMGLVLMIGGFRWGRQQLHELVPAKKSKKAKVAA